MTDPVRPTDHPRDRIKETAALSSAGASFPPSSSPPAADWISLRRDLGGSRRMDFKRHSAAWVASSRGP